MKKNNINNLKQTDFIQILMFANGENEYFFGITKDNMFTFMDYNNILKVSDKGIDIEINDAEVLPISTEYIDKNHPKSNFKSYYTCRNWQFANYFNDYLK